MFDTVISDYAPMVDEIIPPSLDSMEPGPAMAAFLSAIDVGRLSGYDRVVVLRAHRRLVSHFTAAMLDDMAAIHDVYVDFVGDNLAGDATAAEIRAALTLTRRAADRDLGLALELRRLPRVLAALEAGAIDAPRARVMVDLCGTLPDREAHRLVDSVIDRSVDLTTGQLAALMRRLILEIDPDATLLRTECAVADRRVVLEATPEGAANLMGLDLPPHRAAAVARRVDAIARRLRRGGEERSMDQLRADVYLDLLEGTALHGETPAVLEITADLESLVGIADRAAELPGFGPIAAEIARNIAANRATRSISYAVDGKELEVHTGTARRRPRAGVRKDIEARHRRCVFPGCRMPATDCDLDHRVPWAEGGPTDTDNLTPLCRHDHITLRHDAGWSYEPAHDGGHEWTSPLGHSYLVPGRPP